MQLTILDGTFTVHRLTPGSTIPEFEDEIFFNVVHTSEELSLVCSDTVVINSEKSETGWRIIKVIGPLDFSMTGILAGISKLLAEAKISIFVISTFDTDYIMVKAENLVKTCSILQLSSYTFK